MNTLRLTSLGLIATWAISVPCQTEENSVLVQAMQDEMERTLSDLQLEDESQPYFISYTVNETILASESYVLGAQDDSKFDHVRRLTTKVRVGSKSLDNSYFVILRDEGAPIGATNGGLLLPLDDDYQEVRRSLWIATDQAYKEAISQFNGKQATRATQSYTRRPADFSSEETFTLRSSEQIQHPDIAEISRIAQELSMAFADQPEIFASSATVVSMSNRRTYLDSEGNFSHRYNGILFSSDTWRNPIGRRHRAFRHNFVFRNGVFRTARGLVHGRSDRSNDRETQAAAPCGRTLRLHRSGIV